MNRREWMLQIIKRQTTAINTLATQFIRDPSSGGMGPLMSDGEEDITVDMMLDAILLQLSFFEHRLYEQLEISSWGHSEPLRIFHGTMKYGACDECGTQLEVYDSGDPFCPVCECEAQRMEDRRIH